MDCKLDTYLLHEYLDKTIEPLEKIFVEEHLKACRKCRQEFTRMKLLLWELNSLDDAETEIPDTVASVRERTLSELFTTRDKEFKLKNILDLQKTIFNQTRKFLDSMPGYEYGGDLLKHGVKNSATIVAKASAGLLKGGVKIMKMRVQE